MHKLVGTLHTIVDHVSPFCHSRLQTASGIFTHWDLMFSRASAVFTLPFSVCLGVLACRCPGTAVLWTCAKRLDLFVFLSHMCIVFLPPMCKVLLVLACCVIVLHTANSSVSFHLTQLSHFHSSATCTAFRWLAHTSRMDLIQKGRNCQIHSASLESRATI